MFLVTPQQMKNLGRTVLVETPPNMKREAENDLDAKMRAVLDENGLEPYEKIKKYNILLQRYLALTKQGEQQQTQQQQQQGVPSSFPPAEQQDADIIENLPQRDRKNARYILNQIGRNGWTAKGEFISHGHPVKGSHMIDLIKHLTSKRQKPPIGWAEFFNNVNLPRSFVTNPYVSSPKKKIILSPRWLEFK